MSNEEIPHEGEECCTNQQNVQELSTTETTEPSPRSIPMVNSTSSSALSVTSKLSGTGNVLSNWMPWSKRKKVGSDQEKLQAQKNSNHSSSASERSVEENPNFDSLPIGGIPVKKCLSKSKIPLRKPTATLENRNVSSEDAQMLLDKCNQKSPWLFRKRKFKAGQQSISTESSAVESPSLEKMEVPSQPRQAKNPLVIRTNSNGSLRSGNGRCSPRETFSMKSCSSYDATQAHSMIFTSSQYLLEPNLIDSLREVTELSTRLHESEVHVIHAISKYVQDRSLEKELLNIVSNHSKLHLEAERRAQTLTNEMWSQQSEMMKTQERGMRDNIKVLVRENRKLQEDLETLTKRNEKLNIKVSQFPERHKLCDSSSQVLENLSRNNDRLRYKVTTMSVQIEDREKELNRMRRKSESLEQLLHNANSQLQNCKVMLQRTQTDHELEYSRLSHQLQADETIIKESVEAGDVLLEDLDGLKRQLKTTPCSLNWTKLKSRGNSLPDLIYMCRSCLNELANELQRAQTDVVIKEKDKDILKEELARVDKSLEASTLNQERQKDQLEGLQNQCEELQKYNSKCNDLEHQLSEYRKKLEEMEQDLKKEKSSLAASISETGTLNRKVIEKDEELSLNKEKMGEYKSENDALRMQLHGLKQVLAASGSGDVARELADTQEKMTFFQSQYYQLMSEKNYLMEQVQSANVERTALSDFQNNCYQFVQGQQRDLEALNKENKEMKQQLETERNRSSVLLVERNKLKEEKHIMRKIYHQLKSEINKVQRLEGEVVGMNLEANRLAIIAEYNQQLGEKLQCEVAEREIKISELRSNMEELNMAQMENVKDKVALCVELSEVCSINGKLKDTLVTEQQRSVHLDKTKKKIEDAANTQLRTVEEMQKAERAALRDLLRDYKVVVRQRDNLLSSHNEYLQQISDLRTNAIMQAKSIESTALELSQTQEINSNLERKMQELEEQLAKADSDIITYENYKAQHQVEIGKLKEQMEALEASKTYLQNTLQKVHNDLNGSLQKEVETKLLLETQTQKVSSMQSALDENLEALTEATEQNRNLMAEISRFNAAYEELLEKCKRGMAHAEGINEELKNDLEETKALAQTRDEEIKHLKDAYAEKELEIIEMQHYTNSLCEQLEQMETSIEDIDLQSRLLSESNAKQARIQETLAVLRLEHDQCSEVISSLRQDNAGLQQKLQFQMEKFDLHSSHYRQYMEDAMKDYTDQKRHMAGDMQNLLEKYHDLQKEYGDHKNLHSMLCESHKDLAGKLLKAIRMLVNEKLGRIGAEASVSSLSQKNIRLFSEKATVESIVIVLSNELTALRAKFEELTADKMSIQAILCDLQELQRQSQSEVRNSELIRVHNMENSYSNKTLLLIEGRGNLEDMAVEEQSKELQDELAESHKKIMELTIQISNLKQELTIMEFKKSELVLRLHETEAQFKVERNINKELMETNQKLLSEVLAMSRDGSISRPISEILMSLLQGQGFDDFTSE